MSDEVPKGRFRRGGHFARAALKVGANYASHEIRKRLGGDPEELKLELNRRNAEDLMAEFSKLRGTALKVAQQIGCDMGLLPDEFSSVMSRSQSRVPPMNRSLVRRRIRTELGADPDQVFKSFDTTAAAAASLGQVHRAVTHDGIPVAVKIQYPDVRNSIDSDLAMLRPVIEKFIGRRVPDSHFDEVRDHLVEETDYRLEGLQLKRFATLYDHPSVATPTWHESLSSDKVLTMSWVEGRRIEEFLEDSPTQEEKNHFGQVLWDLFHGQIRSGHGTFHGDIHPGNFLFGKDGTLGVVDFGCVKTFPPEFLNTFLDIFMAQIRGDDAALRQLYIETELIEPDSSTADDVFDYLKSFGQIVVQPYGSTPFDFAHAEFRGQLNEHFRQVTNYTQVTGSKHFIFLDRILFGLIAMLSRLGSQIDTAPSRAIIEHSAGQH